MSQCYTNSDDVYDSSLCMCCVLSSFLPLPVLVLFVRTGWTRFELVPSVQPSVFCVFFYIFFLVAVLLEEVTEQYLAAYEYFSGDVYQCHLADICYASLKQACL